MPDRRAQQRGSGCNITAFPEPHLSQDGSQPRMEGLRSLQLEHEAGCCDEVAVQGVSQVGNLVCKACHRLHQGNGLTHIPFPMHLVPKLELALKVEQIKDLEVGWSGLIR